MTDKQKMNAANAFVKKWTGIGEEIKDDQSYWHDLLQNVFGAANVTSRMECQKPVKGDADTTKRIDVYIPETRVLIEQKSLGTPLDRPQAGHKGMTPYQQAKEYDNELRLDEKARWINTSNFGEIWIYNMNPLCDRLVRLGECRITEGS